MDKEIENEDNMPEMTEAEKAATIAEYLKRPDLKRLYDCAPEMAKRRLEVAFWSSEYRGKRNMWPIRELRERIEQEMDLESIKYLAAKFPSETGREHYRTLIGDYEIRKNLTPEGFAHLIGEAEDEDDRKMYNKTLAEIDKLGDEAFMINKLLLWKAICGSVDARAMLGDAFLHEHEVTRIPKIAAFWLKKAADDGDENAENQFNNLMAEGIL